MAAINQDMLKRAQGCLLGQVAGDALDSLVEFQTPEQIYKQYPNGVRLLADGGTFNTIAGQPTDDSEMAILLARSLVREERIANRSGTPIYAPADRVIIEATDRYKNGTKWGKVVIIETPNETGSSVQTIFAHLKTIVSLPDKP